MGLFENAVNTAKSAAKNVGKKAEEVLDLSRNKLNINRSTSYRHRRNSLEEIRKQLKEKKTNEE